MSSALDTFTAGNALSVDVTQIERQLRALWQHGGETVARACLFNLIVWCRSETDQERVTDILRELTIQHPCRAISLLATKGNAPLDASISAHCHLASGGRQQVCSEQISLRAGGESAAQLAPTVLSLLESDLPVILWWRANFLEQTAHFERLRAVADRVIFDTAQWPQAECWLPVLAAEIAQTAAPIYADLNWARLNLWRKLTADCFDEAAFRLLLPRIQRVNVVHGGGAGALLRAMLFASWVASQLGWPSRETRQRVMIEEHRGADVAEVGIESVELVAEDGLVRLHKDFAAHTATAVVTLSDRCGLPHKQAFAALSETALLSQELDHITPHNAYERALLLAASLGPEP